MELDLETTTGTVKPTDGEAILRIKTARQTTGSARHRSFRKRWIEKSERIDIVDFTDVRTIQLSKLTRELISDTHAFAEKVNNFRPLPAEIVKAVQSKLLGERIYNSNAIEGNTLTLRETVGILEVGAALYGRKEREVKEVLGLKQAIDRTQELAADKQAWRDLPEFVAVHELLFREIDNASAGKLRLEDVVLIGAKYQPPDQSYVPGLMNSLFSQLADVDELDAIHVATWVHWAIARIHPFKDGNGRMARLWQDVILLRNGLSSVIIRQQDRTEYYSALAAADDGDFNLLAQVISQRVCSTLQVYLTAQQEADTVKIWAADLVGEVGANTDEHKKLEYIRWKLQMELLRDAFERCAAQITNVSTGSIEVQVFQYPLIDQSAWESLRAGTGTKQTWSFKLICRRGQRVLQYYFSWAKHFWSQADPALGDIGPSVGLFVSEQDPQSKEGSRRLDEIANTPIAVRELLVTVDRLVRKRWDNERQADVYDDGVDPVRVAQEFLQEVLLVRLV